MKGAAARRLKIAAIIVIVAALLWLAATAPVAEGAEKLKAWIAGLGAWGPAIFTLIYAAAVVMALPGSVLTLAAGALFGLWIGLAAASVGSTLGVAGTFLISRYLARGAVARAMAGRPKFRAVDKAIGEEGWKIVALLRLSPAVPFNLQNYLYGLTSIRFGACVLTSWLFMLPGTFLYVYLGYIARAGAEAAAEGRAGFGRWALLAVGLAATAAVSIYIARIASRAIRQRGELGNEG